jgi:hypothetical protein
VIRVARKHGYRPARRRRLPRCGGGSSAGHRVGSACLRARCHCGRAVRNSLALRSAAMPADGCTRAAPRRGRDEKASRAACCRFPAVSMSTRRRAAWGPRPSSEDRHWFVRNYTSGRRSTPGRAGSSPRSRRAVCAIRVLKHRCPAGLDDMPRPVHRSRRGWSASPDRTRHSTR